MPVANRPSLLVTVAVTVVLSVGLWFALVPHNDPDRADARVSGFWWIMIAVAVVLGVAFGRRRAAAVGLALTLPQAVLAFWTAPRSDNDGLWALWIPVLVIFGLFLIVPAWLGGWLRERLARGSN
ncbi:MAG: hypothetical protein ACRD12_09990 [Acidimicrobiales bacterium]